MDLHTTLEALAAELDRTHRGAFSWKNEPGIPDFATAENGMQRLFSSQARTLLAQACVVLHANRDMHAPKIEIDGFISVARQAVADMHADGALSQEGESTRQILGKLRDLIEKKIAEVSEEYTHYFQAWTAGMEFEGPFTMGSVVVLSRNDWLDRVDFGEAFKDHYGDPVANCEWKTLVRKALQEPEYKPPENGLARSVYDAIVECPAIVQVSVRGYERQFSRKLALLVAKAALDALSLGFGPRELFLQQALQEQPLPPVGNHTLVQSRGKLWLPGHSLSKRVRAHTPEQIKLVLKDLERVIPAYAHIFQGIVDPPNHPHPELANRWTTALDWYAEGQREPSDSIALTKLATCLDVLSCGGKAKGITQMISHLTETSASHIVTTGIRPRTLEKLIKDIYDYGRSQILHGTRHKRLEPFLADRQHAAHIGRLALLSCVQRLVVYGGPDSDTAFRTIPPT